MQKYADLVELLPRVRDMGYVRTHRAGDTGVGKTLEDLLGIRENNLAGPNGHMTELKAARRDSPSMLTLFTKAPCPPRINGQLAERFGLPSCRGRVLHTTVKAESRNTLGGRPGFTVAVLPSRVELRHGGYGDLPTPYWNGTDLERAFARKYPQNLLYVKAGARGGGREEEFHYDEAVLMSGFSYERFTRLLGGGRIAVDIRLGRYGDGRLHDHGTGFRVRPADLDACFARRERVM